jgi:hypothetical protein
VETTKASMLFLRQFLRGTHSALLSGYIVDLKYAFDLMQSDTTFWQKHEKNRLKEPGQKYIFCILLCEVFQVGLPRKDIFKHFMERAMCAGSNTISSPLEFVRIALVAVCQSGFNIRIETTIRAAVVFLREYLKSQCPSDVVQRGRPLSSFFATAGLFLFASTSMANLKAVQLIARAVVDFFSLEEVLTIFQGVTQQQVSCVAQSTVSYIVSSLIVPEAVNDSSVEVLKAIEELYGRALRLSDSSAVLIELSRTFLTCLVARIVELDRPLKDVVRIKTGNCWTFLSSLVSTLEISRESGLKTILKVLY